jgi:hypothetical protein
MLGKIKKSMNIMELATPMANKIAFIRKAPGKTGPLRAFPT